MQVKVGENGHLNIVAGTENCVNIYEAVWHCIPKTIKKCLYLNVWSNGSLKTIGLQTPFLPKNEPKGL